MIICPNCKKELADGTKFCKFCGTPVTQTNAPKPVPSNVPKQATPPAPQKKKSSKKIIIAIVAVLLAAIIALGIIFIPDLLKGKKEDNIEEKLAEVLKESTTKPIVEMVCEDYDNNGTIEAYAIVGETDEEDEEHPEFYDADIYFVNEKEAQPIKENVSGQTNGLIELDETTYISIEVYDEDSDEGKSFIYTVNDDKSEESDISGEYSNVHEKDGKVIAIDENGNEIELDSADKKNDNETEDKNKEENKPQDEPVQFSTSIYDETVLAEYRNALNVGFSNITNEEDKKYINNDLTWMNPTESELRYALYDLDGNGIEELFIEYSGSYAFTGGKVYGIYTFSDGQVHHLGGGGYKAECSPMANGYIITRYNTGVGGGDAEVKAIADDGYTLTKKLGLHFRTNVDDPSTFLYYDTTDTSAMNNSKEITESEFISLQSQYGLSNYLTIPDSDIAFDWVNINVAIGS